MGNGIGNEVPRNPTANSLLTYARPLALLPISAARRKLADAASSVLDRLARAEKGELDEDEEGEGEGNGAHAQAKGNGKGAGAGAGADEDAGESEDAKAARLGPKLYVTFKTRSGGPLSDMTIRCRLKHKLAKVLPQLRKQWKSISDEEFKKIRYMSNGA